MNRNICHIVNCFEAGGAQTLLLSLAKAQKKISKKIYIISLDEIEDNDFNKSFVKNLNQIKLMC